MAKNQNLALNPSKVSGGCGRLLCCLTYENDAYIDLRKRLPPLKSRVRSVEEGTSGTVIKTDILNQFVVIETADGRQLQFKAKDIEVLDQSHAKREDEDMAEAESWGEDLDLGMLMGEGNKGGPKGDARPQRPEGGGNRGNDRRSDGPRGGGNNQQQNRGPQQQNQNQNRGPRPDRRDDRNNPGGGGGSGNTRFPKPNRGPK